MAGLQWIITLLSTLQCVRLGQANVISSVPITCPAYCSCYGEHRVDIYCGYLADDSFSGLRHVPRNFPMQVSLLSLYNNLISTIHSNAFRNLTALRSLNLGANRLSVLPRSVFRDLASLRSLDLSANRLSSLPEDTFEGLSSLQDLFLDFNRLRAIPETTFHGLAALQRLRLHNNNLKTFSERTLQGTLSLKSLQLNNNLLTRIEPGTFRNLRGLEILYLNNNNITELDQRLFARTPSLKLLFVSFNSLATLPRGLFYSLSTDAKVSLHNNPFVCDCKLSWLKQWIRTRSLIYSLNLIKCSSPPGLAGQPVTAVPDSRFVCEYGEWSEWGAWTFCSSSCGGGKRRSRRACEKTTEILVKDGAGCQGSGLREESCNLAPCPTHGGWGAWTSWTRCSSTCFIGQQLRTRNCTNPIPHFGGEKCVGAAMEKRVCKEKVKCAKIGEWNAWTAWSDCSVSCGVGARYRIRACPDSQVCAGNATESSYCYLGPCPVDGEWMPWSDWSECSHTCGNGSKVRTRTCVKPLYGGLKCSGQPSEVTICLIKNCPIHGGWTSWSSWSSCSQSCSNGTRTRNRTCSNPSAKHGGNNCTGKPYEVTSCFLKYCPIHGGWTSWSSWSSCSQSCSNGTRTRNRTCSNPSAKHGGNNCTGNPSEVASCLLKNCPIHGGWTSWSSWSSCSQSCLNGTRTRNRTCSNPSAKHGGNNCTGNPSEVAICFLKNCPIHGDWTSWSSWSSCSQSCSNGTRTRNRTCSNPSAKHGGNYCTGNPSEVAICFLKNCPIHGGWTSWSSWSSCSQSCSNGTRTRNRTCSNPSAKHGGNNCTGKPYEVTSCFLKNCPIHGGWTSWSSWSSCSQSCLNGTRTRNRTCSNPSAKHGGSKCTGLSRINEDCNLAPCYLSKGWSGWSNWSECTRSCSNGTRSRTRICLDANVTTALRNCSGGSKEVDTCNIHACPVHGGWSEWTTWSPCSVSCSNGTISRTRHCSNPSPKYGGKNCSGVKNKRRPCAQKPCLVNGTLTNWSSWSLCSVSCSNGTRTRSRECVRKSTSPADYIARCIGELNQTKHCFEGHCPISGEWSTWSEWSSCSRSCNNGTMFRNRTCSQPLYGGAPCPGRNIQVSPCNPTDCPSYWSNWSNWTDCSVSCSSGQQVRYRECLKENVRVNITKCNGTNAQSRTCAFAPCPVNGAWSSWSAWSDCSKTCSIGEQIRMRNCTEPRFGGTPCKGANMSAMVCYQRACPSTWSSWSNWTSCSVSCGSGVQVRTRSCEKAGNVSDSCPGKNVEMKECIVSCDALRSKEAKWMPWSPWTPCSATCGTGHQMRWRFCFPLSSSKNESGECKVKSPYRVESRFCFKSPCNYSSVWTSWTQWAGCSKPCTSGIQRRVRYCLSQAVGIECKGKNVELSPCYTESCPTTKPITYPPLIKLGSPIPCPDPGTPLNGRRKFIDQIEFGSYYVAYFCRKNYYLDGPKFRHCESNNKWSDALPSCRPICGETSKPTNHKRLRIYGGSDSIPGGYPWQVALEFDTFQSNYNTFHCGGTLIAEDWVLTAAHCVVYKDSGIPYHGLRVFLGVHDITARHMDEHVQIIPSAGIYSHPRFSWRTYDSDIALIRLRWKANITEYVRPVCLPNGYQRRLVKPRAKGVMLGWGVTENKRPSKTLKEAIVPVVNHNACKKAYENETWPVTSNMLCAGYKNKSRDSCNRDSGGGFVFYDSRARKRKWFIGGIVSWGNPKCGVPGKYSVFTRVNHKFVKWIKKNMKANDSQEPN
ncbi:SCO-spondin isoform X2 [Nematostella vectensis]|uniref:SCO-spondin isoform X2 n=1 Tax=Nematostella vectensis TaxID=45351 RepID=UPI0020770A4E|nr:SCO-spondin isoform X2 [Nematostella vectensis]